MKLSIFSRVCLLLIMSVPLDGRVFAINTTIPSGVAMRSIVPPKVTLNELIGFPAEKTATTKGSLISSKMAMAASSAVTASSDKSIDPRSQGFSKNVSVDLMSGSASITIPLSVPSGRRGITPGLVLGYSPTQGNGPFGWGWGLHLGEIVRSFKKGVPTYDDAQDSFIAELPGGSGDLVSIGGGEYRSRVEGGFARFIYKDGYWTAQNKSGMTSYFGKRPGSKIESNGKTAKWRLDRVEDLSGNYYVIDYQADGSFEIRYVQKVSASGSVDDTKADNFAYIVKGVVEDTDRQDLQEDYRLGVKIEERRRIKSIEVYGGGKLMGRYEFAYTMSRNTGRSLLTKVSETASDNQTKRDLYNIRYNDVQAVSYSLQTIADPLKGDGLWNVRFREGNGIPDSGPVYTQTSGSWNGKATWDHKLYFGLGNLSVWLAGNTSAIFWTYLYVKDPVTINTQITTSLGTTQVYINGAPLADRGSWPLVKGYNQVVIYFCGNDTGMRASLSSGDIARGKVSLMNSSQAIMPNLSGDFNGDGRSDMATFFQSSGTVKVALSSGNGLLSKTTWIDGFGKDQQLVLGDFNGDGRIDIAAYDPSTGTVRVALSDGTKFVDSGIWLTGFGQEEELTTADINGDGYADLLLKKKGSALAVQVALNNRKGSFVIDPIMTMPFGDSSFSVMTGDFNGDGLSDLYFFSRSAGDWYVLVNVDGHGTGGKQYYVPSFGINKNVVLADFNGDAKTDIAYYDYVNGQIIYRTAIAQGFGVEQSFPKGFSIKEENVRIQAADYNGDGILDIVVYASGVDGRIDTAYSAGQSGDLLLSFDNTRGARADITYGQSTRLVNKYMPFSFPVVQSVLISNNLGDVYQASYSYSGAYWDPLEREFFGFSETTVKDGYGAYTKTVYDQSRFYLRGRIKESSFFDRTGKMLNKTVNQWRQASLDGLPVLIQFVSLARTDQFIYDTPTSGLRRAMEYDYKSVPQYGDVSEVRDLGEVDFKSGADILDDGIVRSFVYKNDSGRWLLGYLSQSTAKDLSGTILAKEKYYYDNSDQLSGAVTSGLLTRKDVWNVNGMGLEEWVTTRFGYDDYGQLVMSQDPLGNRTTHLFDPLYDLFIVKVLNPKGQETTQEYYGVNEVASDAAGLLGQIKVATDPNGQRMLSQYDVWGRPKSVISPLDSADYPTRTFEYQDKGNYQVVVMRQRIESGKSATMDSNSYYDGLGRILLVKQPSDSAGQYVVSRQVSYDLRGMPEKAYAPYFSSNGYDVLDSLKTSRPKTILLRDDQGRVIGVSAADGSCETAEFTSRSTSATDANGRKTLSLFDARGRLISRKEYAGADGRSPLYPKEEYALYSSTEYAYDIQGNLTRVTDALGNVTQITYDKLGNKISIKDPNMAPDVYRYDIMGRFASNEQDGRKTLYGYDELSRLQAKGNTDLSTNCEFTGGKFNCDSNAISSETDYSYDAGVINSIGRLASVDYPFGSSQFVYDTRGREIGTSKNINGVNYILAREYDALDRLCRINYPQGKGAVRYAYNPAGQVISVTWEGRSSQSIINNISYSAQGQPLFINWGNGTTTVYTYDSSNFRLLSEATKDKSGKIIQGNTYSYDQVGNVRTVVDLVTNKTRKYVYDHLNRLVSSVDAAGNSVGYSYDAIGNILKKGTVSYFYGENGAGPHAVTSLFDGTKMSYDNKGNMIVRQTADRTLFYKYDGSSRLEQIEEIKTGTLVRKTLAKYFYDGDGGRTMKQIFNDQSSVKTTAYFGSLYEEEDGCGTSYIFLGGQRVAAVTGDKIRWFLSDRLGSATASLDASGALKSKVEYSPWGEVVSAEKYGDSPEGAWFYFTGKKMDDETGLYFFGARYYDPQLGRFITPDPVVQDYANPQTLNRYAYCNNNPLTLVDPVGHNWFKKNFVNIINVVRIVIDLFTFAVNPVGSSLDLASVTAYYSGTGDGKKVSQSLGWAALGWNVGQGVANSFDKNEVQLIGPDGKQIADYGKVNRVLDTGINTTKDGALEVLRDTNKNLSLKYDSVIWNNTHGPLSDLVESGMMKFTGVGGLPSGYADIITKVTAANPNALFEIHSEATIGFTRAFQMIPKGSLQSAQFNFYGYAVMESTAREAFASTGGLAGHLTFTSNFNDIVSATCSTWNPVTMAAGVVSSPTALILGGGHDFYGYLAHAYSAN